MSTEAVAMDNTSAKQLENDVDGFLKFIGDPRSERRGVEGLAHLGLVVASIDESAGKLTYLRSPHSPSNVKEAPNNVGNDLVLLVQDLGTLFLLGVRNGLLLLERSDTELQVNGRRLPCQREPRHIVLTPCRLSSSLSTWWGTIHVAHFSTNDCVRGSPIGTAVPIGGAYGASK